MDKYCGNCGNELIPDTEYCLKCGKRVNTNKENFDPNIEVNEKPKDIITSLGMYVLLVLAYLFIPSLIYTVLIKSFKVGEDISLLIANISFALILLAIYFKMFKEKIKDYINNFSSYFKFTMKWWGIGLLIMYVSNIIINFVIFGGEIAANEEANRSMISGSPLVGFLSVALLAPFVEEMIFRFGLRTVTGRNKYFPIVSAVMFGLPHILAGLDPSMSLANNLLQFLYVIPYGGLGYAFGVIYNKTDNIFCSMTSHAIHNFMCYVIILLL